MFAGNYVLILHTHLPWVLHHGNWPHGVEWLTEAVAECYIPLLNVFNDLLNEEISPKVSLDISPVLCEQLEHPEFKYIFIDYCNQKILAAQKDEKNFTDWGWDEHHIYLTRFWQDWYEQRKNDFLNKYNASIITAFKELQDKGAVEILTCGATHGYLPLLGDDRSINLQIEAAVENYKKHFGRNPRGIWLPECAYRPSYEWKSLIPVHPFHHPRLRPGIEQFLAKYHIEYFVTDENLIQRAYPIGMYLDFSKEKFVTISSQSSHLKKAFFENTPLVIFNVSSSEKVEYGTAVAFSRHHKISMQVWSGEMGYPGEPDYLDFHKKHLDSMLRYWRVTDTKADMMYKSLYHPDWTQKKIDLQTNHFIHHIENTLNWFRNEKKKASTLCTPFDTELFGHWWFEGPEFIRALCKGLSHSPYVNMATASEELFRVKPLEVKGIPEGSWGKNNNHDVWINDETKWTWEVIYNNENRWNSVMEKFNDFIQKSDYEGKAKLDEDLRRILTQALREMMLLQASDWQFLITTQSARDYAEQRFSYHHSDFNKLCDIAEKFIETGLISHQDFLFLEETEKRNSPFPELKLEWWR